MRIKLFLILNIFLVINIIPIYSQSQGDLNEAEKLLFEKVDQELNRIYQIILTEYSSQTLFIEKLKVAQRAWIVFRDAHIEALYPEENKNYVYGSVYLMCYWIEMTRLTKARVEELKLWIEGKEEGEVCYGSVKKKEYQED